ncbi:MAG: undecaprenyldiphospho-muramoylpentapeptide beta-N-acetylglucosaminyltransferase [Verrucomicrobiota bacterium]
MATTRKILIACGGTGGHLFPGIAVAEALQARGHEVRLLISEKPVDAEASAKYPHLKFETIAAVAKPPIFTLRTLPFLWKLWTSVRHCKQVIRACGAEAVLGMGGFTSLPPVYAGHQLGLKTFIHDSNARPGRANVLTSRFCSGIFLGMDIAKAFFADRATTTTGTPVRPEILHLPTRAEAAASFGLDPLLPTILVTGGSQGAHRLNELSAQGAANLPGDTQVLHIAGASDYARVAEIARGQSGYKVVGFCDQMASAYALADLVIARAGASSLSEIARVGLPSILVPYPFAAADHQTRNAEVFERAGAARLVQERNLSAEQLAALAITLLRDPQRLSQMARAARSLAIADATERVCTAIESSFSAS